MGNTMQNHTKHCVMDTQLWGDIYIKLNSQNIYNIYKLYMDYNPNGNIKFLEFFDVLFWLFRLVMDDKAGRWSLFLLSAVTERQNQFMLQRSSTYSMLDTGDL